LIIALLAWWRSTVILAWITSRLLIVVRLRHDAEKKKKRERRRKRERKAKTESLSIALFLKVLYKSCYSSTV